MSARERSAFVTGGGGYVGGKLCEALAVRGYAVTSFDLRYLEPDRSDGIRRIQGNLCDREAVFSALASSRADVVFHIASYGMSGREMLNRELIEAVNIGGTKHIIEACVWWGVTRLVYTSTYNVVFVGEEIRNGDKLEYPPLDKYVDHYSRTKALAEQEVLHSNGREVEGREEEGTGDDERRELKVCALRCAGIYGEGEQRHLPRIVSMIEAGFFVFTYGSNDCLVEFLHGDNFVQAHIKAAEACLQPDSPVPGQVYYISDGCPINNFEFFRPLVEGLGYSFPRVHVPTSLVYVFAYVTELIHSFVGLYIYNFQPILTRAEVFKTAVSHYFSLERAKRDFAYSPDKRNMDGVVKWFRDKGHGRKRGGGGQLKSVMLYGILFVVVFALVMSFLPLAT